jgi:hypothetical protein
LDIQRIRNFDENGTDVPHYTTAGTSICSPPTIELCVNTAQGSRLRR